MKFKVIRFSRGATIATGNYNTHRFEIEATVEIDPAFDDPDEAYEKVRTWVIERAKREAKVIATPNERKPAVDSCANCGQRADFHPHGRCKVFEKPQHEGV